MPKLNIKYPKKLIIKSQKKIVIFYFLKYSVLVKKNNELDGLIFFTCLPCHFYV